MIDELETRKDTKQRVYIVGRNSAEVIENVYLVYGADRPFSNEEPQLLNVSARTFQDDDHTHYTNLLGVTGSFEIDSDSNGVADGWNTTSVTNSLEDTFMSASGGTYCQMFDAQSKNIYVDKIIPFHKNKKIAFSFWVAPSGSNAIVKTNFQSAIQIYDSDDTLRYNKYQDFSSNVDSGKYIRVVQTGSITSTKNTNTFIKIRALIQGGAVLGEILIDNAQIEFGNASDFKDY
jgi:hypothetical protein